MNPDRFPKNDFSPRFSNALPKILSRTRGRSGLSSGMLPRGRKSLMVNVLLPPSRDLDVTGVVEALRRKKPDQESDG
jgi:hypothetical protein